MRRILLLGAFTLVWGFGTYQVISWKTLPKEGRTKIVADHAPPTAMVYRPVVGTIQPAGVKIADALKTLEPKAPLIKRDSNIIGSIPKPKGPARSSATVLDTPRRVAKSTR
jgi:hypothetical protein